MTFLRNVLHDLVEKKLWPIAIALVVALVAVPIVLGGGSSDSATDVASAPTAPSGPAPGSAAASGEQVVSLEQEAAGKVDRGGKVRDPFVQHHMAKAQKTVTTAVTTTKNLADALGGSSGSSGSAGSGGSAPTPTPTPTPAPTTGGTPQKPSSPATYRVSLKFGETGAEKTYKNVARLTPLPSSDSPFFVFLGLKDDQKTAVFLVTADAVPTGDGHCVPSHDDCQQIEMHKGDIEFFDLQSGTAGVVQYQLELTDIAKAKAKTTAVAAKAHARESKAGREYLRELMADDPTALQSWNYSKSLGLLVSKDPATTPDVANVPPSVAASAAGQPVQQTSTVLTVPSS